ncbi:hypothetical protein Q9L58_001897 [Maublancomyces gigas]|uniref:Protein kinase domain-containing protein n=1 Tax=Discina gigas TaxID=1032678 RepID=A0ABR3GSW3_9PEZI
MNATKLDIEDYYLEQTSLEPGTTTHLKAGCAATDQIGSWALGRRLGQGSSGVVFLQEHTTTRALRAVKMLNYGTQNIITREIRSMLFLKIYRRLFVDFLAWYSVDVTYIAMEYVSGGDLLAYIGKVGPLEEGEAKGIAEQILQAVYILHEHQFMHCDLKPENIFIAGISPVTIKVADLGQTKQFLGSYNTTSGTRAWAAPEQSSPNYNKSVDMWGVGCVVYFLLTSLNPFREDNHQPPDAIIEKYKFPSWNRVHRDSFQNISHWQKNGDKIIVRGVSNSANNFLNNLIVRDPAGRISAYAALQHNWICDTTPLEDIYTSHTPPGWPNTSHPLIGAAQGGHLEIVNYLLKSGVIPKSEISGEILLLALQAALQAGHHQIESVLLQLVPPIMVRTHLFSAIIAGYKDCATLITTIEQYKDKSTSRSGLVRVDVDCLGYRLFFPTMLSSAMETGNIDNIRHLLSDPPSRLELVKPNIFETAVSIGRRDVVQLLVQSYEKELKITRNLLKGNLSVAVRNGHLGVVQYLLSFGALPDRGSIEKATLEKNKALVQLLIKALIHNGSPQNIETAQELALRAIPLCDVWLLTNRDLNISDAANGGDLEVVRYLLPGGRPHSGPTNLQTMALVGATMGGHIDIVRYVCSEGIDLTSREPWDVCAQTGHMKVLEFLLQCGQPDRGVLDQAMGIAAKAGHLDVVMVLLNNGAWWNGLCDPLIGSVLAAFKNRGRTVIGAQAISRN